MEITRHYRRMLLVQAIFAWEDRSQQDALELLSYIWKEVNDLHPEKDLNDFDRERMTGMVEHIDEIRQMITTFAPEWPLDRIASHDRAVLYLGIFELMHTDVPAAVVINEAVELAKDFGGDRSSKFINGVLSTIHKKNSN